MIDNPHFKDIEAEKAVLGAVLVDNSCIYDIQSKLKPSDFSEASHSILWTIFIDKAEHRWPIDIISVSDAIKTGGYGIDEKYLYDVSAASFSSANVDYYVRIVFKAAWHDLGAYAGPSRNRDMALACDPLTDGIVS